MDSSKVVVLILLKSSVSTDANTADVPLITIVLQLLGNMQKVHHIDDLNLKQFVEKSRKERMQSSSIGKLDAIKSWRKYYERLRS